MDIVKVRGYVNIPLRRRESETVNAVFVSFHGLFSRKEHFAIRFKDVDSEQAPLVRLHSECATGDLFGSTRCDCGPQLSEALDRLAETGGYLLYLRQEGRDIGLFAKLDAYRLQDQGMDTFEANRTLGFPDDRRDFTEASMMLKAMGVRKIRLLSNNPEKARQLEAHGINVIERVKTGAHVSVENLRYLDAKVRHAGHEIALPEFDRLCS
jgi:GTP cyclohydrolase II